MLYDPKAKILSLIKGYHNELFSNKIISGQQIIPASGKVFNHKELLNLVDASLDFWLTEGEYNTKFEAKLKNFLGVDFAATVNSGSSANLLAFYALTSPLLKKSQKKAIKRGDEVICSAVCFPTTINPVIQFGCTPVLLDCNIPTYNPTVKDVISATNSKTKAVFMAHTLGNPYEAKEISTFCSKKGIWLIEDCCDALGAEYKGKKIGTFGDVSTLSFYPAHQITCGEGGAILTNNPLLNKIVHSFRDWGRDCWCPPGKENTCGIRYKWKQGQLPEGYDHKYIYSHMGFNMKMTDLQAATGCAQIDKIKKFVDKRRENHEKLYGFLKEFSKYFILPEATKNSEPSWFGFTLTIKKDAGFTRPELLNFLEQNKIGTRLLFAGNIVKQPAYKNVSFKIHRQLKNADIIMNNTFWIGCYPGINNDNIKYIYKVFDKFICKKKKTSLS